MDKCRECVHFGVCGKYDYEQDRINCIDFKKERTRKSTNIKKEIFQMRISKDTRADLDRVAKHYNLSASATVDMLIAKETRLIYSQTNKGAENSNGKS